MYVNSWQVTRSTPTLGQMGTFLGAPKSLSPLSSSMLMSSASESSLCTTFFGFAAFFACMHRGA